MLGFVADILTYVPLQPKPRQHPKPSHDKPSNKRSPAANDIPLPSSTILSILLPIFASYKALRAYDPALLAKWLTYWTTLSLFLLAESQLYFILYWVPFYPWIRLAIHCYLIAPGKQGAAMIYQDYIHPFLEDHERQLDGLIDAVWEKVTGSAADYLKKA